MAGDGEQIGEGYIEVGARLDNAAADKLSKELDARFKDRNVQFNPTLDTSRSQELERRLAELARQREAKVSAVVDRSRIASVEEGLNRLARQRDAKVLAVADQGNITLLQRRLDELARARNVRFEPNVNKPSEDQVRAKIALLAQGRHVDVMPEVQKRSEDEVRAKLAEIARPKNVQLNPTLDQTRAADLRARLDRLADTRVAEVKTRLDEEAFQNAKRKLEAELAEATRARDIRIRPQVQAAEMAKLRAQIDEVTRDRRVNVKTDVDRSALSRVEGLFRNSGGSSGNMFSEAFSGPFKGLLSAMPAQTEGVFTKSGPIAGAALAGGIQAAMQVALPALGAMVSGALFAAVGTGGLVAAFMSVKDDPRVKGAMQGIKNNWDAIMNNPAMNAVAENIAHAFTMVGAALKGWGPQIQEILRAGSTFAGPIAQGLIGFVDKVIGPLTKLMSSSFMKDIMNILSSGLTKVGAAIGQIFTNFLKDPKAMEGAKKGLEALINLFVWGIKQVGVFLIKMSEMWADLNRKGKDGKSTLDKISAAFTQIGHALQTTWGVVHPILSALMGSVGSIVRVVAGLLTGNWRAAFNGLKDLFRNITSIIRTEMGVWLSVAKATYGKLFQLTWQGMQQIASVIHSAWSSVTNDITHALSLIVNQMHAAWSIVVNELHIFWSSAVQWLHSVWSTIINEVTFATGWIVNALHSAWSIVVNEVHIFWSFVLNTIHSAWSSIINDISFAIQWVVNTLHQGWQIVINHVHEAWSFVLNLIHSAWSAIINDVGFAIQWVVNTLHQGWSIVISHVHEAWASIINQIHSAWSSIINDVHFAIDWIGNKVTEGFNAVKNTVTTVFNDIWNFLESQLERWKSGIDAALGAIANFFRDHWNAIKDFFVSVFKDIVNACLSGINNVIDTINKGAGAINGVMGAIGLDWKIPNIPHVGFAEGGNVQGHDGRVRGYGPMRGPGTGTSDEIPAWLSNGEFVVTAERYRQYKPVVDSIHEGSLQTMATGGEVVAKGYNYGGVVTTGTEDEIIRVAQKSGIPFGVSSAFRGGSTSAEGNKDYHSMGLAVDFTSPNMPGLAAYFMGFASALLEEIHSSGGGFFVKNGKRVGAGFYGAEVPLHYDHVHIAATLQAMQQVLAGHVPAGPGTPSGDGSAGGAGAAPLNPFLAQGWDWILKNKLAPAEEQLHSGITFGMKDGGPVPALRMAGGGAVAGALSAIHSAGGAIDTLKTKLAGVMGSVPAGGFQSQKAPGTVSMNKVIKSKVDEAIAQAAASGGPNSGALGDDAVERLAYQTAKSMGASDAVMMALFEAGFVESGFRNLQHATDHDSLGFLQQRPSAGWPSPLNVPTATRSFVSRAMGKSGSPGQIAQAVQVSAFPGRYDQAAGQARAAIAKIAAELGAGAAPAAAQAAAAAAKIGAAAAKKHDNGGWIPPGWNYNGTNEPELALNPAQGAALLAGIERLSAGSGNSGCNHTTKVYVDGVEVANRAVVDDNNDKIVNAIRRGY